MYSSKAISSPARISQALRQVDISHVVHGDYMEKGSSDNCTHCFCNTARETGGGLDNLRHGQYGSSL